MSANNETFNEAISLHQSKKFNEALAAYLKILDKGQSENLTQEQASVVSQNIAVLYMQQGNADLAYIFNKKALSLNPGNSAAQQFSQTNLKHFKIAEIPREMTTNEQLNNLGLRFVPFEALAILVIIFISISLKSLFSFLIKRKKSLIENTTPTSLSWNFYVFVLFFLICSSLLYTKNTDLQQLAGIIKSPSATVRTAAGVNQASITEITLGHTVQILQTKEIDGVIYAQIKVPGAFSGWIKKEDLEPLNFTN